MPEIIYPVFAKTSPKRSFSMTEYERFGLVFTKTQVYKFGHRNCGRHFTDKRVVAIWIYSIRWKRGIRDMLTEHELRKRKDTEPVFFNVYGACGPSIDSKEWILLAGRYDNPVPPRFLAPIDFLIIPALEGFQDILATSYQYQGKVESFKHGCKPLPLTFST